MHDESGTVFDIEFDAEVFELLIVKLQIVINDDDPREAELIDDKLPHKLSSLSFSDLSHQLSFHPFGEVVNGYK